ncbi:MAG: histidinol-phosphatase [Actinomycetia bacterium]|nr:histidinol-phosphatase [Actinomycetes bacterium]
MSESKSGDDALLFHGSVWLRADFHLHTKADKEFSYTDNESDFVSAYIGGLKKAGIQVGVIANHNKFDLAEFKALRKAARSEDVFLLPGIELSIGDGSNGVHTLVVFDEDWIDNREATNYIQNFLDVTFAGQTNYDNKNDRSNHGLIETLRELDKLNRDYFLVFAHVEAGNGLWGSLSGGRIGDLGREEGFQRRCRGFQKVRTHDVPDRPCRVKVKNWLRDWYPAEVEGSDCKTVDQIGQGRSCYLKIGAFTFEAVQYALVDHEHRVAKEPQSMPHSHIRSISFQGGVLDGKAVLFSPEMNTLIGIRGSGKSSILEAIRYVLDIPFGEKASDRDYKENLVRHVLGSGGKAVIHAVDRHGQQYEIRRILNETPDLFVGGILQPGVSIRETVVHKPIYFGQKDLSTSGEGFEKDLVEKLIGDKLNDVRRRIEEQEIRVQEAVDRLQKLAKAEEQKKEWESEKTDAEYRLKKFKEYGVEEKLQRQVDFDTDARKLRDIIDFAEDYCAKLNDFISRYEDDLRNASTYKSKQNRAFFDEFFLIYGKLVAAFDTIKNACQDSTAAVADMKTKASEFDDMKKGLREGFAQVERKLAEELKISGAQTIRSDEFLGLRKQVDQASKMLDVLGRQQAQRAALQDDLLAQLNALNDLWHEEFKAIQAELDKVNEKRSSLTIQAEYKGDRQALAAYMKDVFRGSRIRERSFQDLSKKYADFREMYRDLASAKQEASGLADAFEQYFNDNLTILLTWQTPNDFAILYRGKELKHHSLGQRASALMLFVLSQRENDVIIIDQPEDDLDNQTIYEDVIKLIRDIKRATQFIFATHNANFPVLGDAEQMHACAYSDDKISLRSGSIDKPKLQTAVVDIMEGGQEAFNRRREIYQIWNPTNS